MIIDVATRVNAMREQARLRNDFSGDAEPAKPKLISLDIWPDVVRGVPNSFLRSALFGVSNTRKMYKKRTLIAAVDGYEIRFKGEAFNQTDLDVWETLLHLARLQPLGTKVEFTVHALLKKLGRSTSGNDHERLKDEMARLIGGVVEICDLKGQKTYMGALVHDAGIDEATKRWEVVFNPAMLTLYKTGHTLIDWSERQALGKNNLAKWLHGHYATHASPFPYKVETLRDLSGSEVARLGDFRKQLRVALDALKAIGAILNWSIDEHDLVHIVRSPSRSQLKHLAKPKRKI